MRSRWLAPCLVFALAACEQTVPGSPDPAPWSDLDVDFGPVFVGTTAKRTVRLANPGATELRLAPVEREPSSNPAFAVTSAPSTIPVGGSADIQVEFRPTQDGAAQASFVLSASGGATRERAVLRVQGTGVECGIEVQDTVDFGTTAVGDSRTRELVVRSACDLPVPISVSAISGDSAFSFVDFAPGERALDGRSSLVIPLRFAPSALGSFAAALTIVSPSGVPLTITLRGTAVAQPIVVEPSTLKFAFVEPGRQVTRTTSLRNQTTYPVSVSVFSVLGDVFTAQTAESAFVLGGGESRDVDVTFAPTRRGVFTGTLTFSTDSRAQPQADVQLEGTGGGPAVDVADSATFGRVEVGGYRVRRLVVANVGTDVPTTTEDNLQFAEQGTTGEWTSRGPEIVGGDGEFALEPATVPATGIPGGSSSDLRVRFSPKSAGAKHAKLVLHTNDPLHKVLEITLDGTGENMPPCSLVSEPAVRGFGIVEPSRELVLPVVLRNVGTTECRIVEVGFEPPTSDTFSLVNGPIDEVMLAAGAELRIPVRFAPRRTGSHIGALSFYSSDTSASWRTIALKGEAAPSCLFANAEGLQIGALVGAACTSKSSTVTLYNVCSSAISISRIALTPETSSAFTLASTHTFPFTVSAGGMFDVRILYAPTVPGDHAGALLIESNASTGGHFFAFDAHKPTTSTWTDVFTATDKTDVLFVVDDSGGTERLQLDVSATAPAILQAAQGNDFHLAITTTSVDAAHGGGSSRILDANGRLMPLSGSNPRILTPTTPNAAQVLAQNLIVGQNGSLDEMLIRPAYLALSNPNLTGPNAGFLRADANLAVVIVSEAADADSTPLAFYQSWFVALKPSGRSLSFHGLIPTQATPPNGNASCGGYDSANAGTSDRTRILINRTGGSFEEVCGDVPSAIRRIAARVFGPRTRFRLSNRVDGSGVLVAIDGQAFPATGASGERRWTYNSVSNEVVFEAAFAPEPGKSVSITYSPTCL